MLLESNEPQAGAVLVLSGVIDTQRFDAQSYIFTHLSNKKASWGLEKYE